MIRNIVFDMGGVLLDLHTDRIAAAFASLYNPDSIPNLTTQDLLGNGGMSVLHDYECGLLSTDEWLNMSLRACRPGTTRQQIINASFAILGDLPEHRLEAIRELRKKGYKVYLLSNVQDLHWDYVSERWFGGLDYQGNGYNDHTLFDEIVLSQRVGHTKPDPEIYDTLIQKTGLIPSESLYFDDVLPNVEGGLRAGLQAIHATGDEWLPIVRDLPSLI